MGMRIDPLTGEIVNDSGPLGTNPELADPINAIPGQDPNEIQMNGDEPDTAGMPDENEIQMTGDEPGSGIRGALGNDPNFSISEDAALMHAISQTPAPGESVSSTQGGSQAAGVKTSSGFKGITEAGKKQAAGIFGKADAEASTYEAQVRAQGEADLQTERDITARHKALLAEASMIDKEHFTERMNIHNQQREFNEMQARLEESAAAQAKVESMQYIAKYNQDMAGVRNLMMESGNPLGGLSATSGLGLGIASFAQGFLGARGININVTGQIDKWVDRELQQHQQKIVNQTAMANSNLTLYDIARQGAKDDWETRQRLRGFLIDGMKIQIGMEADKYHSQMARVDALAKGADLDMIQAKNTMDLHDKVNKEARAIRSDAVDKAYKQASASVAAANSANDLWYKQASIKNEQDRLSLDKTKHEDAKKPPAVVDPKQGYISDPFDVQKDKDGKVISGGKSKWKVDYSQPPAIVKATNAAVTKMTAGFANSNDALNRLRELYTIAKPDMKGPEWMRQAGSQQYREYKQQAELLIQAIIHEISGAQASDKEAERKAAIIQADRLFQSGSNDRLIDNYQEELRKAVNRNLEAMDHKGIVRIPDSEQTYDQLPAQMDPAGGARNQINLSNKPGTKLSYEQSAADAIGSGRANEDEVSKLPGSARDAANAGGMNEVANSLIPSRGWTEYMGNTPQPLIANHVEELFKGIIDPEAYKKAHPKEKLGEDASEKMLDSLREVSTNATNPDVRRYATTLVGIAESETMTPEVAKRVVSLFK